MCEVISIVDKNIFAISAKLLDLPEAQLWVGHGEGPMDDDDERVKCEREEDLKAGKIYGIEAMDLTDEDGWFLIDVTKWPEGKYRLMIHSHAGIQSDVGTKINEKSRDLEYSWPILSDELIEKLDNEQKQFIYRESNGRGYCFRIEILPDRSIVSAGNIAS